MTADLIDEVRAIATDIFNMFGHDGSCSAPPESLDEWDSLQRLNLVLALEEYFAIEYAPADIESVKALADFAAVVREKREEVLGESRDVF